MRKKFLAYSWVSNSRHHVFLLYFDFRHIFARIYNHPYLLYAREQSEQIKKMLVEETEEDANFLVSDDDDEVPDEKNDEFNNDDEING